MRDSNGLGINVDDVGGKAVIGAVTPRGAAAKQSALRAGDFIIKVFEFDTPTYDQAIAGIKGTAGGALEMTMLRRPVTTLLKNQMDMQLGAKREWRPVTVELFSNREVKVESLDAPVYQSALNMREAGEIVLVDLPSGGATMSISSPSQVYELRVPKEGQVLHRWERKLNSLFPQLDVSIRKEGWLEKKGDTLFQKRWCVMTSQNKLHYYKDVNSDKEQGTIDLSVAYAVSDIKQGLGFEIATPGRTWTFKAEDKSTQVGLRHYLL